MADTSLVDLVKLGGYGYAMGEVRMTLKEGVKYKLELTACDIIEGEDGSIEIEEDEKYEKLWMDVYLTDVKDGGIVELPTAYFYKKGSRPIELKEVSVTASRIIFYHKGDTLIYRADAFVLPEGSMLDALFDQLPGVELRSNGEIYCQGRRVDNLLLNGKDLFNGKKELMLENIGAYTVKDIATYEKTGYLSELMDRKVGLDVQYVMDVRLKKEYHAGLMMSLNGGYGTHNRYIGKLFGMWYNDFCSVATYVNLNNLSDSDKPGKINGAWGSVQSLRGVESRKNAGITYTVGDRKNTWNLKGDVDFAHTDKDIRETMSNQTFMSPNDMFNYRWQTQRQKNIHLSTSHTLQTNLIPKTSLYFNPKFEYNEFDDHLSQLSAVFNRDMSEEISREFVSNIYENNNAEILKSLINRNTLDELNTGHNLSGAWDLRAHTRVSDNDMMGIYLLGDYLQTHSNRFRKNDVRYGANNVTPPIDDYRYFKLYPDRTFNLNPRIDLRKFLPDFYNTNIPIYYEYSHQDKESTSELYNFDQLQPVPEFGVLPSMVQYRHTLDPDNSYRAHTRDDSHKVGFGFSNTNYFKAIGKFYLGVNFDGSVTYSDRSYNYTLGDVPSDIKRRNILYEYSANLTFNNITDTNFRISLSSTPTKASLADMVDLPHTDPLNIFVGNRSLKDSYNHTIKLRYYKGIGQSSHSANIGASLLQNAQARSYVMDPSTGVRTFSTHNVQGNWNADVGYNYFTAFGQGRKFDISSNTKGSFVRSVDLVGGLRHRRVSTVTVGEYVNFNWKIGNNRLTAFGDALWHRYLGKDEGFSEFSAWNMRYGVSGVIDLPHNWGISSDITMYTRQGYHDPNLNTTDVVWNARVSKSLLKGSLVLALDAYDILHQISTVSYMVNAQARTETVVNSIPSYLLFHIYYRFNKQPKKR